MDFVQIKIVDTSSGLTTKIGETGEILVRGTNVMLGYYNDADKTREVITSDGWYRSG